MMSLKIIVAAISVSSVLSGAENTPEKYIQDKYKMQPSKAGALYVYSQIRSIDCGRPTTVSDLKEFEGSKTFIAVSNENSGKGPLGFYKLRQFLNESSESINC